MSSYLDDVFRNIQPNENASLANDKEGNIKVPMSSLFGKKEIQDDTSAKVGCLVRDSCEQSSVFIEYKCLTTVTLTSNHGVLPTYLEPNNIHCKYLLNI